MPNAPLDDRLAYTPAEAARALGVCRMTIYNMIERGQLRSIKIGAARRIPVSSIDALLAGADETRPGAA